MSQCALCTVSSDLGIQLVMFDNGGEQQIAYVDWK